MFKPSIPITHILLADSPDAAHIVVAIEARKPLVRGQAYRLLAVNAKGEVAVAMEATPDEPLEGPKGHWWPMDLFQWRLDARGNPVELIV